MSPPAAPRKWQAPPARPRASAQQAAAAILRAALHQARGNARGTLQSSDPEYLHQLRVGLRRYRSALRLFRGLLRGTQRRQLARRARDAMRPLGEARDWDVCIEWLDESKAPGDLIRRARLRRDAVRKSLRAVDLSSLDPDVSAWKKKAMPLERFRIGALTKARRKVAKRLRRIDWSDAEQRHRLRIAIKRLRYATDFLGGETGALERLQDGLGGLNDVAVARRHLAELDPPAAFLRKLAARERRLLAAVRGQVASLEAED
jgi:CHAD domain-containing protein